VRGRMAVVAAAAVVVLAAGTPPAAAVDADPGPVADAVAGRAVVASAPYAAEGGVESLVATAWLPWRCRSVSRALCANKTTRRLYYVRYGVVQRSYPARFGSSRYPTRNGTFSVYWKDRWHWSSLYGSAMPFSLFFSGGQAIHYSENFASVGYAGASHGCINLNSWSGARWLFDNTPLWTRVYVGWW